MMDLINQALLPLQFEFVQNAFLISICVAVPAALLSCFLVLKGWSLMGDAVSHAVLPGIVLAYLISIPLSIGAFIAGMICALATGYIDKNSRVKQDTVMGVVFSGMFGLGLVLYTKVQTDLHLDHILFGDILGIGWPDIAESAAIALLVSAIIALKWRDLMMHAFDPSQAQTAGLSVRLLHYGLLCILSLTIVGALKAVGIILAIAMLIAPGAIAFLITRRFGPMLLTAVVVAVGASLLGVYASLFINSAPAPTIVLIMTIVFIGAFAASVIRAHRRENTHA
jgi:manganese/iron transport system permease protein